MARQFEVRLPLERAYTREAKLGVELLDAVTLERVSQGVEVTAHGLTGKPKVNGGGLFVWVNEDVTKLVKLSVEPRAVPFEGVEVPAAQVTLPLHRIEKAGRWAERCRSRFLTRRFASSGSTTMAPRGIPGRRRR
jgi:hypothetical protein